MMTKQMPLYAELSNCLSAYKEIVERILLECIANTSDSATNQHDSLIPIQVQDLLNIEDELQRHLRQMDEWDSRQQRIQQLEEELKCLSDSVNAFAQKLSSAQTDLRRLVDEAAIIQKGVKQSSQTSLEELMRSSGAVQTSDNAKQQSFASSFGSEQNLSQFPSVSHQ